MGNYNKIRVIASHYVKHCLVLFIMFFNCSQITYGQRYLKKIDRWNRKHKYEKIARKTPQLIKKNPSDMRLYYYASLSELKLSEKTSNLEIGYKHVLKGIKYYNRYQTKTSESQISVELKTGLHSQVKEYYKYFESSKNKSSIKVLDGIMASTFKDTTDSYRLYLLSKNIDEKLSENKLGKHKNKFAYKYHENVVIEAMKHKGKPYKYAAKGPDKFDCSGFTRYVYLTATSYELPHSASMQSQLGREIEQNEAIPGDLVFFGNPETKRVSHAGIIIKMRNNKVSGVIHCVNSGVTIDTEENASWSKHWKTKIVKFVTIEDLVGRK